MASNEGGNEISDASDSSSVSITSNRYFKKSGKKSRKGAEKKQHKSKKEPKPQKARTTSENPESVAASSTSRGSSSRATCASCRRHAKKSQQERSTDIHSEENSGLVSDEAHIGGAGVSADEGNSVGNEDAVQETPASPNTVTNRKISQKQSSYSLRLPSAAHDEQRLSHAASADAASSNKGKKSLFSRLLSKNSAKAKETNAAVTEAASAEAINEAPSVADDNEIHAGAANTDSTADDGHPKLISVYEHYIKVHQQEIQNSVDAFFATHQNESAQNIVNAAVSELESCRDRLTTLERSLLRKQARLARFHERAAKLREQHKVAVVKYTCCITDSLESFQRRKEIWTQSVRHWTDMIDNALLQLGTSHGRCQTARSLFVKRLEESRQILAKTDKEMKTMCDDVHCRMEKCRILVTNIDMLSGDESGKKDGGARHHVLMYLVDQTLKATGSAGIEVKHGQNAMVRESSRTRRNS